MTYTLKLKEERKIGHEAGFREGMEKGIEKGLQKGTQKGKLEDALEMLKDGVAVEKIAKYTGLSPDMITALKQEPGFVRE